MACQVYINNSGEIFSLDLKKKNINSKLHLITNAPVVQAFIIVGCTDRTFGF